MRAKKQKISTKIEQISKELALIKNSYETVRITTENVEASPRLDAENEKQDQQNTS